MLCLLCCGKTWSIHRYREFAGIIPLAVVTDHIPAISAANICIAKPMARETYGTLQSSEFLLIRL